MRRAALLLACALAVNSRPCRAQAEIIAAIQVHGNTLTAAADIIAASGLKIGDEFDESLLAQAEARLRRAIRLDAVDVVKRYASISDPTQILVVIQIDEGPVRVANAPGQRPVVVRRSPLNVMVAPILDAEDGYGLAYGLKLSITGQKSSRRRVIVPASWGGDKRAGVEFQQEFGGRLAPDVRVGLLAQRRTHPFFDEHADRRRIWGRAEWNVLPFTHAGTEIAWQRSSLGGSRERARSLGADIRVDTRLDPLLPHNAVLVRAFAERLHFETKTLWHSGVDTNAYVGVYRSLVLALRAVREDFSGPAPAFYQAVLGGSRNLRGFSAGYRVGDTLAAASAELRVPMTSPLRLARLGLNVFADFGTAYEKGERLQDQKIDRGYGVGIWAAAPVFGISAAVAHGVGGRTRAHISAGLTF